MEDWSKKEPKFRYMLLDRLRQIVITTCELEDQLIAFGRIVRKSRFKP